MAEKRVVAVDGIDARDWFALQALPACIAHLGLNAGDRDSLRDVASLAYKLADAMRLVSETQPEDQALKDHRLNAAKALASTEWLK